jgi:hypothetical protein
LAVLFGNTPQGRGAPKDTVEEVEIGKYMRGAWAAFANDPVGGLKSYGGGWPEYVPGEETLIRLAFVNKTGINVGVNSEYDAACNVTFLVATTKSVNGTGDASGTETGTSSTPTASTQGGGAERLEFSLLLFLAAVVFSFLL